MVDRVLAAQSKVGASQVDPSVFRAEGKESRRTIGRGKCWWTVKDHVPIWNFINMYSRRTNSSLRLWFSVLLHEVVDDSAACLQEKTEGPKGGKMDD